MPAGGLLWINASAPWKAIYQTSDVTFTYISDLPAEAADDAVAELIGSGTATAAASVDGGPAGPGTDKVAAPARRGPACEAAARTGSASWSSSHREPPVLCGVRPAVRVRIVTSAPERVIFLKCLESTARSFSFC